MANRVGEGERNGRKTWVYDSGLELYQDTRKIAVPPPHTLNYEGNKDTNPHRRRIEKTALLLRRHILDETQAVATVPVGTSAEAVAYAGGQLWSEVVLNDEAYHRDRLEAFEKLGKYAQALPADIRGVTTPDGSVSAAAAVAGATAEALLRFVADVMKARADQAPADVVDGTINIQIHEANDGEEVD